MEGASFHAVQCILGNVPSVGRRGLVGLGHQKNFGFYCCKGNPKGAEQEVTNLVF
jgi:hypothetical protein